MAGRQAQITHREWRKFVQDANAVARDTLGPALEHRHAGLVRVQAGETQIRNSLAAIRRVYELAVMGESILGSHDQRLTRVGEAQAAAGGVSEVAGDKRYNQR